MYLSLLLIVGKLDLQIIFLKLGGWRRAAIGGASKVVSSSGFLKSMALKCLLNTSFIFGRRGLKTKNSVRCKKGILKKDYLDVW